MARQANAETISEVVRGKLRADIFAGQWAPGTNLQVGELTKRYGASFDPYLRPITRPVAGSVKVAVAGVELMSGWAVDVATGVVTFTSAPATGAAVTAGFLFDVPVRFDTDRLDVELTSFDGAEVPAIPLVEILPCGHSI